MKPAIVLLIAVILLGCVSDTRIGPVSHHGALFGSFYNRVEDDADDSQLWVTSVAATFGHRNMEWYVDDEQETGSFELRGVSDNLRAVIGDDFGVKAIDTALCGFIPTSCIGGAFGGGSDDRLEAMRELLESEDRDAFIEAVANETRSEDE